jgi:hypothetical protein
MLVNKQGNLTDNGNTSSVLLRGLAQFFSYLFHPLLVIVWVTVYLLYVHPTIFLGENSFERTKILLRMLSTGFILPFITVLLLKGLGFVQSIQLHTQRERIIPYVACITFFFWNYYVSKKLEDPPEMRSFLLAVFLLACAALMINNYTKVSMHTMAAGCVFSFFVLLLYNNRLETAPELMIVTLLAGIVCTSRLIAGTHKPFEIMLGFITGFIIQLFSWWI